MRGLSNNEGDVEDDAAAAKKNVILCVNTEIFVQALFHSLFQTCFHPGPIALARDCLIWPPESARRNSKTAAAR